MKNKKKILLSIAIVIGAVVITFGTWLLYINGQIFGAKEIQAQGWSQNWNMATLVTDQTVDWQEWRGTNRKNIVTDPNLNLDWSQEKPSLAWTFRDAGSGYSSPIIVGTTLYMSGAANGQDFAFALDTETGSLKWRQNLGRHYTQNRGDGPRGTIAFDDGKLYLIRGAGQIHCISADDGKEIWQKDLAKDFGGKVMSQWGYSESPLVDGDLVIATPGSSRRGTMVALNKNTGATVWVSSEWTDQAGYSSPIVVEIHGVRQYIQQAAKGVAGVSAIDGKVLWKVDVPGYRTAVVPTPIYTNNVVYVTSGYNAGCAAIEITKEGDRFAARINYANRNMVNHHGGVVLVDGHIYGFSDQSGWTCQSLRTGEQVWTKGRTARGATDVGKGAILAVNDRLLLLEERRGLMGIVAASPQGWQEFGTMEFPERTSIRTMDNMVWAHPVIADGKLFVRDQDLLFAFDLTN
ncbi:MAG: PQQ-like beta-propeller repeat protein [Bacteroidales bacterium]|nr:PQQ-like beta-propeller repeat protein [Bacteroidales bacterium]